MDTHLTRVGGIRGYHQEEMETCYGRGASESMGMSLAVTHSSGDMEPE